MFAHFLLIQLAPRCAAVGYPRIELMCMCAAYCVVEPWVTRVCSIVLMRLVLRCAAVGYSRIELMFTCAVSSTVCSRRLLVCTELMCTFAGFSSMV